MNGVTIVDVAGDLDHRGMVDLKNAVTSLAEGGDFAIVLNLRGVRHANLMSIGVLVDELRFVREKGGDIRLAGLRKELVKVFSDVGTDKIFKSYRNLKEAVGSFRTYAGGIDTIGQGK